MEIKNLGRVTGLSAYEIWLQQGNIGTEDDFLNSLKASGTGEETDPTVPAHVKDIKQSDIDKWNAGGNVDLSDYATKEYVDNEISSALVDLPSSGAEGCVTGVGITTIMAITQNDYDNLVLFGTVDDSTLYIIKPESDAEEELNMIPYLTSDGQAYIDLGIAPIDGASYEVCIRATDGIGTKGIFGDRWTNITGVGGDGTNAWISGGYNGSAYATFGTGTVDLTKKRIFTLTPNSLILDNDITTEITAGTTNEVRNMMHLFTVNVADKAGVSYPAGVAAFTFFYMKIYDADGNPLYYYIPAEDNNGVACIFEAVNKTYLYNASDTGEFVYGEELEVS